MSSTPSNTRTFAANTGLGLKLTPSNSPYPRTPRSPQRPRGLYESGLSLKRIIGTTVSSPTTFDTLSSSPIFAYTAGAAAVVVDISNQTQRFYRARPTAIPSNASNASSGVPSTPTNTANDGKNRTVTTLRESAIPHSPTTPYTPLDWGDSPSSKTWTSRERIKAATCLSISRDGKLLAVGETGYSPRVLIFSLQENSSDTPLAILNEHTFGVRAVAFSQDGRFLASLGSPNDGFLYVWSINQRTGAAKLHSSNKCTSSVKQMLWLGKSVVTIGTRHIKIWRVEDGRSVSPTKQRYALDGTPQPVPVPPLLKTLAGRNVLLGPLVEATFSTLAAISEHKALICSEKGDVCLLDDSEGQKLVKLTNTGFAITCIAIDMQARRVRVGGRNGKDKTMNLDDLLTPSTPPMSPMPRSGSTSSSLDDNHLFAMGYAARRLITVNSKHLIKISNADTDPKDTEPENMPFPAHGEGVLGVRLLSTDNESDPIFLTWSADGTVVFWNLDGTQKSTLNIEVDQWAAGGEEDVVNQCLCIRASKCAKYLVSGDKYGVLRVTDSVSKNCIFETRAHSSDIQDIALFESEDTKLIASCGRDRTVQLFRWLLDQWVLIQTLDEHAASVCGVFFTEDGESLISCSADRTINIRQLVKKDVGGQDVMGAVPLKIITLKASPVSMAPCSGEQTGNFMVSLLDRSVVTYEISSGRLVSSFKATDNENAETVVLDALVIGKPSSLPGCPTILAGVSSTDKSVRIYDGLSGGFLDREWGHTAAVTDVALLERPNSDQKILISTGSDGTIMLWDLLPRPPEPQDSTDLGHRSASPSKETPSARPPLRRVLSKAELAEFQRASPAATPTGNRSPPRVVRRKTSRYGLSGQSPTQPPPVPPITSSKHFSSASEDSVLPSRRANMRTRSRSPPSPKSRDMRRPSLASLDSRGRTKSTGNSSEFGSLNMATEQACRTLRAYRKKLLSSEMVKEESLKELDQELRLTAIALGEKSIKSKGISETVLTGLLDQYSDRLVSMFDEKLRLTKLEGIGNENDMPDSPERPKTAGNTPT